MASPKAWGRPEYLPIPHLVLTLADPSSHCQDGDLPSGAALVRQFLQGQNFLQELGQMCWEVGWKLLCLQAHGLNLEK